MSSWPSYTYIEDLTDRINLRSKVLGGAVTDLLPYPDRTNYQKLSLVKNIHRAIEQIAGRPGSGGSPAYGAFGGCILDQNYDGTATSYPDADWQLTVFTPLTWALIETLALGGNDWEMKYHREVANNSSTVEAYRGDAVADGQRAYRKSDRQIVDRVSGAWVANTTASHADYITAYGEMIGGDFFTQKIFDQIEAVLALLTTIARGNLGFSGAGQKQDGFGTDPSFATAKSLAEADYGAATPGASGGLYAWNNTTQNSGPGDFNAFLHRSYDFPYISFLSPLTTKTVTFYGLARNPTSLPTWIFDSFGDPVLNQLIKTLTSGAVGAAATTYTGAQVGSLAQPAPTWSATPDPVTDYSRGYFLEGILAAIKYDF